jgi:hypothetical protein
MEKLTIQDLRDRGWIAFEYIRGSHAYGLNTETSDKDIGGVFIIPQDYLMGLRSNYIEQVADETNDTVFYEFGRWIELLMKANPTALESLFIPEHCIIGPIHPAIKYIMDNRDSFLSKECFKTLYGYGKSQIGKARGLNKKIVNPVTERKGILDFCFVPFNQGSISVEKWLRKNGLKQRYCGLVPIPNMREVYGLYYDFGTHIICEYGVDLRNENSIEEWVEKIKETTDEDEKTFITSIENYCEYNTVFDIIPSGYHGIVSESNESNEIRLESIPKGKSPIILMSYNKDGYTTHCKDYREYKEWERKRNPIRYESNLNQNYDGKNMCHAMRLMRMGKELAMGQGFNVERTYDREFLLDIKNHKFEYDEIISKVEQEQLDMDVAAAKSNLKEVLDYNEINELLIKARNFIYETKKGE